MSNTDTQQPEDASRNLSPSTCSFRSLVARKLWKERHWYKHLGYEAKNPYVYGQWRGRLELLKELAQSQLAKKNSAVNVRSEAE